MEEHQSITRLKRGDIGGLEELVQRYYLQAVRAAYLVVQDQALAEDIVQTSFLNLHKNIRQFDETRTFRPWFLRSVINNAISACRQRRRNIPLLNEEEDTIDAYTLLVQMADVNMEEKYISTETQQMVQQALLQLSPRQRAALIMRYYLELSENEISQEMKRPKSTVKWVLFTARKNLSRLLMPLWHTEFPSDKTQKDEE